MTVKMQYLPEKRIVMVKKFHQLSSSLKVRQPWITKYLGVNPPTAKTMMTNVNKFQKGTIGKK